ncbi:DUF1572 family protein [Foetidibacter luteolus]|uniref:DUF1572 family protein n=1 Tax=Foetidibacter luteolus TaxID=2608880 RepID=UPI00129C08F9|nr:DUF1572 family protein [Foetidibacter luteolus]
MEASFLKDVHKRFLFYKDLGDKTFEQLEDKDFFYQPSHESNSIALIIQHMYGNMMSRFTNFLTEDGEKPWRNRDTEFDVRNISRQELTEMWNKGWDCVLGTIANLSPADLTRTIFIRTEPLIVYDALLRQLAHYPYHVGQIVFIGKMIKDASWNSLSIAKGDSNKYNEQMKKQTGR